MYQAPPPSPAVSSTTPSSERPTGIAVVNQVHVQKFGLPNGQTSGYASMQNQYLMVQPTGNETSRGNFAPPSAAVTSYSNHRAPVCIQKAPNDKAEQARLEKLHKLDLRIVQLETKFVFEKLKHDREKLTDLKKKLMDILMEAQLNK